MMNKMGESPPGRLGSARTAEYCQAIFDAVTSS
jgi:hypothetical protein